MSLLEEKVMGLIQQKQWDLVKLFIEECDVDVNYKKDKNGDHCFMSLVAMCGNLEIIKYLFDKGYSFPNPERNIAIHCSYFRATDSYSLINVDPDKEIYLYIFEKASTMEYELTNGFLELYGEQLYEIDKGLLMRSQIILNHAKGRV